MQGASTAAGARAEPADFGRPRFQRQPAKSVDSESLLRRTGLVWRESQALGCEGQTVRVRKTAIPSQTVARRPARGFTLRGVCPGDQVGLYLRYQGELLGLWDPQTRDLRRNYPQKRSFRLADYHPPLVGGVN